MSGHGAPAINLSGAEGLKVTIVAGMWHETIAEALVAKAALENGADAVVALGVIIRGGTPHFEYVSSAATTGLTDVALQTGKPVGFGVLTLDNEQQGLDRAGLPGSSGDKGAEAAEAALHTALVLRALA